MSKYYFAYGSCMDYEGRIKNSAYASEFDMVGIGMLKGYRFCMNKRAANGINAFANIVRDTGHCVYGVLYRITDRVEREYLDKREGFNLRPRHYDKEYDTVTVDGREYKDTLFYVATPNFVCREPRPASKKYQLELERGGRVLPEPYRSEFMSVTKA